MRDLEALVNQQRWLKSHLHDFFFLRLAHFFHLLDLVVGELLDFF